MSLNDLLSTNTSLKPEIIGQTLSGIITKTELSQVTDYTSGELEFWPNGDPKMQIRISMKTDDGREGAYYMKAWGPWMANLKTAVTAAGMDKDLDAALAPGNRFSITYTHDQPNEKNPRLNPAKIHEYKIEPRANITQAVEQPAPTRQPPAANNLEMARQLHASGVPIPQIAQTVGLSETAVNAILTTGQNTPTEQTLQF